MRRLWIILLILLSIPILAISKYFGYGSFAQKSPSGQAVSTKPVPSSEQANIRVTSPTARQHVSLPFAITGEARVFENQLRYRVFECNGRIIDEGILTAKSPDVGKYGPFRVMISALPMFQGTAGCIEVFSNSAKDGSEINVVTIPVSFDLKNTREVRLFFGGKQAPVGEECTAVYPVVRRIVNTKSVARNALEELLKGPMALEKNKGLYTNINPDVELQKLTIENGIARADFSNKLESGVGGSCRVTAIRRQISETLMQFPTVSEVIISVDGKTDDVLQP